MDKKLMVVQMNIDQVIRFYALCDLFGADTKEKREAIMQYMVQMKQVGSAYTTNRTEDQVKNDLAEKFNMGILNNDGTITSYKKGEKTDDQP